MEPCSALSLPRPLYGAGGSGITGPLSLVARALAAAPEPVTLLYSDPSSCLGFGGFLSGKVVGTFWYWTADGTQKSCAPPAGGQSVDFAYLGHPASLCADATVGADIAEWPAPVVGVNVITGVRSDEQSISAEALYFIYGFGAAGEVLPWTNDAHVLQRGPSTLAQLLLGAAIEVPAASFKGNIAGGDIINQVIEFGSVSKNDALAFVSAPSADRARTAVKTLAYQARGQTCAYWPDSSADASDKINIRNGQYDLWARGHWFTRVDPVTKTIVDSRVRDLFGWFEGTALPPAGIDVLGAVIDSGAVPLCAMHVTREGFVGAISSWAPEVPCGHFFDERATGVRSGHACVDAEGCSAVGDEHECRFGFCEGY